MRPPRRRPLHFSDGAGLLQRLVSAILIDGLETARGNANTHELLQFRYPNTLAPQIRRENAWHHFRDVPVSTALLLGQAAPVNNAASHGSGSCNLTNFHGRKKSRVTCRL